MPSTKDPGLIARCADATDVPATGGGIGAAAVVPQAVQHVDHLAQAGRGLGGRGVHAFGQGRAFLAVGRAAGQQGQKAQRHRGAVALGRRTPAQAFAARTKASPRRPGITVPAQHRVRRDRVDSGGNVTLRYQSRLRHLGVGRRYAGTRVMLLVADRDVRVINEDGELLAEFTINPIKDYQPHKRPGQHA